MPDLISKLTGADSGIDPAAYAMTALDPERNLKELGFEYHGNSNNGEQCWTKAGPKHPDTIRSIKDRVAKRKLKEGVEGVDDPEAYVHDLPSRQAYLKQRVDNRTCTKPQAVEYACLCAESVLHIFEKDYPQDDRPRQAIEAARRWLAEPTEANRLHAADAAYAATYAANTANAFAATAAYFAADASAATTAAYFAADASAAATADAAAYAAAAAADYAEKAGGAALPESLDDEIKDPMAYALDTIGAQDATLKRHGFTCMNPPEPGVKTHDIYWNKLATPLVIAQVIVSNREKAMYREFAFSPEHAPTGRLFIPDYMMPRVTYTDIPLPMLDRTLAKRQRMLESVDAGADDVDPMAYAVDTLDTRKLLTDAGFKYEVGDQVPAGGFETEWVEYWFKPHSAGRADAGMTKGRKVYHRAAVYPSGLINLDVVGCDDRHPWYPACFYNRETISVFSAAELRAELRTLDESLDAVGDGEEDDAADPLAYAMTALDPETVLREFGFTQAVNGHHWWERKGTLGLLMVCWEPDRVPPIILCKYKNEGGLSAYTGGEYMADATALRRSLLNNLHLTEAQELIHLLLDSDPDALDPRVELDRLAPARCPYCNSLNVEGPDKLSGYYDCLGCNSWFTQKMVDWETHARSQMQQEGLDDFDPSAEAKRLTTYTCPDCGSTNTSTPDGEGLCDCGACGVFFNPKHPDTIRSIKDRVAKRKLKEGVEGVDDPEAYVHDLPSRQAYLKQRVDNRTCTKPQAVEYACLCAEGVLHLFEQDHPQDDRPRKAIEAARRWLAEPTEANRQAADAAADAASAAAAYFAASADYASAAYFAAAASADAASAAAFAANATATYAAANAYDAANAAATYAEKAGGAALPESLDDEIKDLRAYAMQHGLPPRICTSYTKVTPESAADGDYSEQGWEDEDGETFVLDEFDREEGYTVADLAVKWLRDKGAWETSSSSFYPGGWYSTSGEDTDFRTGETTQYNFHLSGFTPEQEKEVWDKFHEDTGRPGR